MKLAPAPPEIVPVPVNWAGQASYRAQHPVVPPSVPIIITIDGPAGTGKSSVARELARRLGLDFLDTGAMYRAAAVVAIDRGLDVTRPAEIVAAVIAANLTFDWKAEPPAIHAWGRAVGDRLRSPEVTAVVSPISAIPELRRHLVAKQREIGAAHPRLVTEGRDQGSVVFPSAAVKFYLDADPVVRAARRADQLRAAHYDADERRLLREITDRDRADSSRPDGPLTRPADAVLVDTTALGLGQVVDLLERIVRDRLPPGGPLSP